MSLYDDFKISYPPPCFFKLKRYDNYDMRPYIVPSCPQSLQGRISSPGYSFAPLVTLIFHLSLSTSRITFLKCSFSKGPITRQMKQRPIVLASKCRSPLKILKKKAGFAWNSQSVRHNVQCNFKFNLQFVMLTFPIIYQ